MKKRQIEIIYGLQTKKEDDVSFDQPYDILIHAVLNTIEFSELVNAYIIENISETRSSIFSNIEKRVEDYNNHEKLYDNLKSRLENKVSYIESQRIRKILELLLSKLDSEFKSDFFTTFFYSKYSNDRKSAVNYAEFSKVNINRILLAEYLNSENSIFLIPLLKENHSDFLAENILKIWKPDLSFYYKKQIIELIVVSHFDKLQFLKDDEYDLYLFTLIISKKIKPEQVIKNLGKVEKGKRHFTIFNISKLVNFELIENEIKKYIS